MFFLFLVCNRSLWMKLIYFNIQGYCVYPSVSWEYLRTEFPEHIQISAISNMLFEIINDYYGA